MIRGFHLAAIAVFAAGCDACTPPEPPPVPPDPIFSSIQARLFTPSCTFSSCHATTNVRTAGGLDLTVGHSYRALINMPTKTTTTAWMRIVPGDPSRSYILVKLNCTGIESSVAYPMTQCMPRTGQMLPQPFIDAVRVWIQNGAIDDTQLDGGDGGGDVPDSADALEAGEMSTMDESEIPMSMDVPDAGEMSIEAVDVADVPSEAALD